MEVKIKPSNQLETISPPANELATVGQVTAGIAHDFNTLMNRLIGQAELIRLDSTLSEESKINLEQMVSESRRAVHLMRQVLDFSRQSIKQHQPIDLVATLNQIIHPWQTKVQQNIQIKLEIEPGPYLLHIDQAQIEQLVDSLITNAQEAMPDGGTITVHLSTFTLESNELTPTLKIRPGDWVSLTITDSGHGIAPEVLPHIYEPFYSTKTDQSQAGLGLARVYGIVKQHRGQIRVRSQQQKGTAFTIYLPRFNPMNHNSRQKKIIRGHGQTLLLVEDESAARHVTQALLTRLGYQVLTAQNGRQALDIYARHRDEIALILTDLTMPDMGGDDLAEALRQQNPTIKVIALTGFALEDISQRLSTPAIVDWAQKPIGLEGLGKLINRWL